MQKIKLAPMMNFKTAGITISAWITIPVGLATGMLAATIAVGGFVGVPGMIYVFGLRICWDRKVFIEQAVRAGDKITFYKSAKVGDTITTKLSIADKKEVKKEKDGKVRINKFLYINMNATNQNNEKITDIQMSFLLPRTMQ